MNVCSIILTHQAPDKVVRMCQYWNSLLPDVKVIVAYGGNEAAYNQVEWDDKVFVADDALRTSDHQRECQSYACAYRDAMHIIAKYECDRVLFTEFDHVPLRSDYFLLLEDALIDSRADVLMHGLCRVNDTGYAHFLYHADKPSFYEQIARISYREAKDVVLSAYGFGQYWTREAYAMMAEIDDEVGCYLEIWAATVAHHLGFRVKSIPDPNQCNDYFGEFTDKINDLKEAGSWSAHPLKHYWDEVKT